MESIDFINHYILWSVKIFTFFNHRFGKNGIAFNGIIYYTVGYRSDELSVLDYGASAHSLNDAARRFQQFTVRYFENYILLLALSVIGNAGYFYIVCPRFFTAYRTHNLRFSLLFLLF